MPSFNDLPTIETGPSFTDLSEAGAPSRLVAPARSSQEKYEDNRAVLVSAAVQRHLPPEAYRGLQVGPTLSLEYEPNVTPPVEGSQALLRQFSPFMLQVEPPWVFGEDGGFINKPRNSIVDVTAYSAASGAASGYDAARTYLSRTGIASVGGFNANPGGIGEYVTKNASGPNRNSASDGTSRDNRGKGDGKLGEPALADLYAALDIAWQLSATLNTPPLVLLINPSAMTTTFAKIQQFQERTRFGYVFHTWGEEQPRLSITAQCGGFVSQGRGYQFSSKRDSAAWQNWMNMFHLYRNNGYIHDTVGKSFAHHHVGALSIHYDGWVYYGNMESFNYTYDEGSSTGTWSSPSSSPCPG